MELYDHGVDRDVLMLRADGGIDGSMAERFEIYSTFDAAREPFPEAP